MTLTVHPQTQNLIHEIAHDLREYQLVGINDDRIQHVNYVSIGKEWVQWFIKCLPQLKTVYNETIEASWLMDVTYETVEKFYNEL